MEGDGDGVEGDGVEVEGDGDGVEWTYSLPFLDFVNR